MKLWQKIFLLTLVLVIAVVSTTSLILLTNNHHLAVEREQEEALSRHNYIVVEMRNQITYTQLRDRIVSLNEEEALQVALDVMNRQRSESSLSLSLYKEGELLYSINEIESLAPSAEVLLDEPDFSSIIEDSNKSTYLLLVSTVVLNDISYQLVSSSDITSTYQLLVSELDLVRIISVVSGLLVAGILLLLTQGLLSPLHNLSTATHLISEGDLDRRADVRGNDEVAEVARNFNVMADSIEQNVTALENVAEARRIFIGNLAHEMKTPLTSILGFADLLRIKRTVSDEERQEYAGVIVQETKHLQGLSGKLMDLLTTQNIELSLDTIDALDYSKRLELSLTPILERSGITLAVHAEYFFFAADRELVTSLIYNLVDNAVKASPPGSTITLSFERVFEGSRGYSIAVTDEGSGIPAEEIPLLTEPFYMLDKARTRKHGGAGLGLALCVEIAEAHGATLSIQSELGKGSRVQVVFPASSVATEPVVRMTSEQATEGSTEGFVASAQASLESPIDAELMSGSAQAAPAGAPVSSDDTNILSVTDEHNATSSEEVHDDRA